MLSSAPRSSMRALTVAKTKSRALAGSGRLGSGAEEAAVLGAEAAVPEVLGRALGGVTRTRSS